MAELWARHDVYFDLDVLENRYTDSPAGS